MAEPWVKPAASASMAEIDTGAVAAALASEDGCVESLQPDKRKPAARAATRRFNSFMLRGSDEDPGTLTPTARASDPGSTLTLLRSCSPAATEPRGSAGESARRPPPARC